MNTFGTIYTLTSFGESHGPAIGGVINGVPAGIRLDIERIRQMVNRRRPGQSDLVTQRREPDSVEFLSGIFEGRTLGTPIGFIVRNSDQHSADYDDLRDAFRPSHADYVYQTKYGLRDHRGGGRSSARETLSRVVAGAVATQILEQVGIKVFAYTSQVGDIVTTLSPSDVCPEDIDLNPVRCPDQDKAVEMAALIRSVKAEGDTIGGVITGVVRGCPVGLGNPVFGKLSARLAEAMLSISAAKGFDLGMGFDGIGHRGSEMLDHFVSDERGIHTTSNHSGGIQGGISNGEEIYFRVAFKPVATLLQDIDTVRTDGTPCTIHPRGRHDACVLPRAVPVVEAMAAMVILDAYLLARTDKIS